MEASCNTHSTHKHRGLLSPKFVQIIHTNPDRTSQETQYASATEPNRLMLFGERVAVYCENHMEHTNTLCGQNAETFMYKNSVRASQETHYVSATETNRLMLFRGNSRCLL
jgi:hypothetical protein